MTAQINKADCPFYKTVVQNDKDRAKTHERLVKIDRYDLVEKFECNGLRL